MTNVDVFAFWGKAQAMSDAGPRWHPLVFHCIDVAAVGSQLLRADRSLSERLCGLLGLKEVDLAGLVPYLLSLHDIGKFAKRFQAKAPEHYPSCFNDSPEAHQYDHASGGFELFEADSALLSVPLRARRGWRLPLSAVTGHHGAPPKTDPLKRPKIATLRSSFGDAGIEAARRFAADTSAVQRANGYHAVIKESGPGILRAGGRGGVGGLAWFQPSVVSLPEPRSFCGEGRRPSRG